MSTENPADRLRLRRRALLGAAAAAGPVALALKYSDTAEANDQVGAWSAPFDMGGVAIHATLMHTDEVLFFQYVEGMAGADHTSYVATWNWKTGVLREAPFSAARDVFCAGHNVLPDGRVFIAGGHDPNTGKKQDAVGVVECDIFDPVARTWTRTAPMGEKRWYPTNVGLPNGKVLVFGGTASPGVQSATVDEYTPATNTMRRLPSTANKSLGLYPRMHLLANGRLLMSGPPKTSVYFDPATNRWTNGPSMIYGKRSHGVVALLPGSAKLLTAGGGSPTRDRGDPGHLRGQPEVGVHRAADLRADAVEHRRAPRRPGADHRWRRGIQVHPAGEDPRAVQPRHGDVDRDGGAPGQPDVPRDRAAAARRPGPVRRAGQRVPGPVRRDLLAAVPVQGGPPDHQQQSGHRGPGRPAAVHQSRRGRADEGRADPARRPTPTRSTATSGPCR